MSQSFNPAHLAKNFCHGKLSSFATVALIIAPSIALIFFIKSGLPILALTPPTIAVSLTLIICAHRAADRMLKDTPGIAPYAIYGVLLIALLQITLTLIATTVKPVKLTIPEPSKLELSADQTTLKISGAINYRTLEYLRNYLNKPNQIATIGLTSSGGIIPAARLISELIIATKLDTIATGPCYSACTLMFMAGKSRTLSPEGELGFHRYRITVQPYWNMPDIEQELADDILYFQTRGVSPAFTSRMFDAIQPDIWIPSTQELLSHGLTTR